MSPLERIAQRLVWWKPVERTLKDPAQLLARAMAYGTLADLQTLLGQFNKTELRAVLEQAPPGIFDRRAWRYWHVVLGLPTPAMPVRTFGDSAKKATTHAARP